MGGSNTVFHFCSVRPSLHAGANVDVHMSAPGWTFARQGGCCGMQILEYFTLPQAPRIVYFIHL